MKRAVIKIFGEVGVQVTLVNVISQVKAASDFDEVVVLINSPGGFVNLGYDIYNYLRGLKKPITTVIDKQCASIATVIALAGDKGSRLIIAGSEPMIHNPWTMEMGDASRLADTAAQLEEVENELINFYSKNTGIPPEGIRPLMAAETFMTPEEYVNIGFCDRVITQEEANQLGAVDSAKSSVKAYAKFNPQLNKTAMSKENKDNKEAKSLLDSIKALINGKKTPEIKALDFKTTDGKAVNIESKGDVPAIGDKVTVDGQPAPSVTLTLDNGIVIETDANSMVATVESSSEEETEVAKAVKAKDAEIAALKKELADVKKENADQKAAHDTQLKAINEKVEILAKNISSKHEPEEEETTFRSGSGEVKGKGAEVKAAIEAYKGKKK